MKQKNPLFLCLAAMFAACSSETETLAPTTEVQLQLSMPGWDNVTTRADQAMLYPINILLSQQGSTTVYKKITVVSGTQFSVKVPEGTYDIHAVCGLPTDIIPTDISNEFSIPDADEKWKTDFGVGVAAVTTTAGANTMPSVNIAVERKMSWLDLQVTGVPSSISDIKLHIQGLYETYTLDQGWKITQDGTKRYTRVPLSKDAATPTVYKSDNITLPCFNMSGVTFLVEATTTSSNTMLLTYTSNTPMGAGIHLVQQLDFSQLTLFDGSLTLNDWNNTENTGSLDQQKNFAVGDTYLSYPATVYYVAPDMLCLFPHKPMTAKLADIRSWTDFGNISYSMLPEITVARWAFPISDVAPLNLIKMLNATGLNFLNTQINASGNTAIDAAADNILAYYDKSSNTFYRYDFQNMELVAVDGADTRDFLIYPGGIIMLTQ